LQLMRKSLGGQTTMGLNVENLFVKNDSVEATLAAIRTHLDTAGSEKAPAEWPLEVSARRRRRRKIAVSDARQGWIALVDDTESVDPALAISLSMRLRPRFVVTQVFEVSGNAGVAVIDGGIVNGGPTCNDAQDPLAMVRAARETEGVPFDVVTFRETVGPKVTGWQHLTA
jgi:hypothetical protein